MIGDSRARVVHDAAAGDRRRRGYDLYSGAVHVELLLAVVPDPREQPDARLEVARDLKVEALSVWPISVVAMWAISLVGCSHMEGASTVGRESNLTRASVMIAS